MILHEGSAPGRGSGPTSPRNGGRLLTPRHHQYGQHAYDKRVSRWRWRSLAVFIRSGTQGSKGSQHRRVHGPRPQSHDPACHRSRTWSRDIQDLQWLLVFWPTDHRRASARLARCVEEVSSGLGHHNTRTQSRVGTGRTWPLLSLWQDLRAGVSRARVSGALRLTHLFDPLAIRNITFANRVFVFPT